MMLGDTPTALYGRLKADATLIALLAAPGTASIYHLAPPNGAAYAHVVFNYQGGGPDLQTSRNIESNIWNVRGYSTTSAKAAAAIAGEIDRLLHKQNFSIGSAVTFWCAREENLSSVQQGPDNQRVWLAGGLYRIRTSGG